jgi:hypothetical protein
VPQIVERPLVHHVVERDLSGGAMQSHAVSRIVGQRAQQLHVGDALVLEVVEGVFGIGIPVEIKVKRGIVRLQLRTLFR